jgi:hypothetical protein
VLAEVRQWKDADAKAGGFDGSRDRCGVLVAGLIVIRRITTRLTPICFSHDSCADHFRAPAMLQVAGGPHAIRILFPLYD